MSKRFALFAGGLLALMAGPALATVTVTLAPQDSYIPAVGATTAVEIRAEFTEGIIGWGLDVQVGQPQVAELVGISMGPSWDGGMSIDGDGLSAISDPVAFPLGVGPGTNILLATLTFQGLQEGTTPIWLTVSGEEDEGFALSSLSGNDALILGGGTIVVPEPSSLALLALCGLALRRR